MAEATWTVGSRVVYEGYGHRLTGVIDCDYSAMNHNAVRVVLDDAPEGWLNPKWFYRGELRDAA